MLDRIARAYAEGLPDTSAYDGGVWETAIFTVPIGTPEARIEFAADKYRRLFGNSLEAQGFEVLSMSQPVHDLRYPEEDPTRKRYGILAWCRRRPQELIVDVPDVAVPDFATMGFSVK